MIFPEAFSQLKHLQVLNLDEAKFKHPEKDLAFLKQVEGTLCRLSLNHSFPKENLESIEVLSFLKMEFLEELNLQQVGLLQLRRLDEIFPNLTLLDLSKNKILMVEALDILKELEYLAEVNFNENPICIHGNLKEMVMDVCPTIEVVNRETLKDAGFKYKEEFEGLRKKINDLDK